MTLDTVKSRTNLNAARYKLLLSQLIALVDTGRCEELSVESVLLHARSGAISILLGELFQNTAGFNVFTHDDWKRFNEEMARLANASEPPQKTMVANPGISLLMSWAVEGIQRRL